MIYLDNAATSFPKPQSVYLEMMNCMQNYCSNPGRGSHDMAVKAAAKVMETREEIAKLFHIQDPFQIVFTSNATEALNIGTKGAIKPREHVISTVIEHNSVLRPLNTLHKKGVTVTLLGVDQEGFINMKDLKKEIRKNTKMIIINHASNVLGTVQPIGEIGKIARENGILFMVDASQSAGKVPIDVEEEKIDLLAFPGHKGLLGPQGTGALYIRNGIRLNNFRDGGTGSQSNSMTQPDFLPDKFESGTLNTPGIAGLCEGIKFIQKEGLSKILRHEQTLTTYLAKELSKLSYVKIYGKPASKSNCSVLSINIDGVDSSKVGEIFNDEGIAVRTGYHCAPLIHGVIGTCNAGTVRISPGYFNSLEEIEKVIQVIQKIYASH